MKKSLLALVLPSLFASTVGAVEVYNNDGQAVDLYGRAYAGHDFSGEGKNANYGNDSYIRLGAKLKSDISDSLSAFARYELQYDLKDSETSPTTKTRLAYIGLDSDVGAFSFGRQYNALTIASDLTDVAYTNAYGGNLGNTSRDNSTLKYSNKFAGLQLDASYRLDDNQSDVESDAEYSLAATYKLDFGLMLAAGFSAKSPTDDYDASLFLVGASYKTGPMRVAATFAQGAEFEDQNTDHTAYELSAEYKITKQLRAQVLYNVQELEDTTTSITTDAVDDLVFGVRYDFNKSLRTVAEYRINGVEGKDDDFHLAARYSF
ncbi:porin [Moritella marina ATCC 15381]|uniref:Porin n=1 Tax=Moritella marina ATCC 15381 TaxID=1202962 RepID=A0A5J6WGW6_MORMI|nr:porin [Moritella marina]QFI36468.1 porin [Moritella marina ATCC 15381]